MKNKKLLGILGITALLLAGNFAWQNAKEVDAAGDKILYFNPGVWNVDGAVFWGHFWGNGDEDVKFTDADGDGIYQALVRTNPTNVIFTRCKPASTNVWDGEWNRIEVKVSSTANYFKMSDWSKGTWDSTYNGSTYYLLGTMNDSNWAKLDEYKFVQNTDNVAEVMLANVSLNAGDDFKVYTKSNNKDLYYGYNKLKVDLPTGLVSGQGDSNIKVLRDGIYNFYWDIIEGKLWVENNANESVKKLFSSYYGSNGSYTKVTELNVNTDAMQEISKYFHAGAQAKYRQTVYSSGQLVMKSSQTAVADWNSITNTSTYKDNNNNGVDHLKNGVKDYSVSGQVGEENRSSVENWFVTLNDFKDSSITGWTYASGVYTFDLSTSANMEKMAREFVAPMWLATDEAKNYVTFTSLTVQETTDELVMKLYASSEEGKITDASGVFAQATITK